jgi:hypothetical protein
MSNRTRTRDAVAFIGFLGFCLAVSGTGGAATATGVGSG